MKEAFRGHYRPTEAEFEAIWRDCTFVLDANVLLNLYRYSPSTASELIGTLEAVAGRLWVAHQAAKEYHANRLEVICEQARRYDAVLSAVAKAREDVKNKLEERKGHPFSDPSTQEKVMTSFEEILECLADCKANHPDLLADDTVLRKVTALLAGKVGPPPDEGMWDRVEKEGEQRYKLRVPPRLRRPGETRARCLWRPPDVVPDYRVRPRRQEASGTCDRRRKGRLVVDAQRSGAWSTP